MNQSDNRRVLFAEGLLWTIDRDGSDRRPLVGFALVGPSLPQAEGEVRVRMRNGDVLVLPPNAEVLTEARRCRVVAVAEGSRIGVGQIVYVAKGELFDIALHSFPSAQSIVSEETMLVEILHA